MTPQDEYDDLPCLTDIVSEPVLDDLPILTEIVINAHEETDAASISDETESVPEPVEISLPLTALRPAIQEVFTHPLGAEDMQHLLQHIEAHLETVFTEKLNNQLEQLQKLAVDLAVSEFKAELPQLLHDALSKPSGKS